MNLSAISEYDNVNCGETVFSKSHVYRTINDLLNINGDVEVKIFCPLCVNSFAYTFSLFEHLRTFHQNFLLQAGDQNLRFKECPICSAKFYGKHLTAKHALLNHSKMIKELFLDQSKCFFCRKEVNSKDSYSTVKHIEEVHFLDFVEEFKKKFSCDSTIEMTMSELINSSNQNENSGFDLIKSKYVCIDVGNKDSGNKKLFETPDFEEASKINCFDFADLKEQLENIKSSQSIKKSNSGLTKRSILKDVKNSNQFPSTRKSVRRVLRFDLPDSKDDNKENSVLLQKLGTFKQINEDELGILCPVNKLDLDKFFNNGNITCDNWCEEPKHSSTPTSKFCKETDKQVGMNEGVRQNDKPIKSNFKSYLYEKNSEEFEFQCGKCRKLFNENTELVCHLKNNHRKFSLKLLQPCYRCAICDARFFKNYYLRKHHRLHKPY